MDQTQNPVDTTQQVTSKVPTAIVCFKNPKRDAAGKAIAEKRRQAREAQKQKIAEADIIIANERLKKAQEEAKKVDESAPSATPEMTLPDTALPDTAPPKESVSQTLSTTQWLSVIAIGVSMVGVYYNRQALKNSFYKIKAPVSNSQKAPVSTSAPASANSQKAPASANVKTPKKKFGIQTMA